MPMPAKKIRSQSRSYLYIHQRHDPVVVIFEALLCVRQEETIVEQLILKQKKQAHDPAPVLSTIVTAIISYSSCTGSIRLLQGASSAPHRRSIRNPTRPDRRVGQSTAQHRRTASPQGQ